jgi:hypothetical protein
MSTTPIPSPQSPTPSRFREAQARGERLGRQLKRLGKVSGIDEALLARIGQAFGERDEPGHALANAIRTREVAMAQFRTALARGIDAVPDAPPALRTFFDEVTVVPEWVDFDLVNEGGRVMNRLGQNASDVLLQLSLIGGYRFGGPTDLLVATGGLAGNATRRRLAETQKWTFSLTARDAMRPPTAGNPGGEGWRLTVHVRAMHALVNASFEPRWNIARWGLPINQADQAGTLGLFDGVLIIGCRAIGVRITSEEARALMHLWRWTGYLMGVDEQFLTDDEWERHRQNYHVLLAQAGISEAGPRLAQAILAAQQTRHYPGWPDALQGSRAWYEKERILSMLTMFLGVASMRDLGLPPRPPWAFLYILPLNALRYHVFGRTSWGRRRLAAWGRRSTERLLASYFVGEAVGVASLEEA